MRLVAGLVWVLATAAAVPATAVERADAIHAVDAAIGGFVEPATARFETAATTLRDAVSALCAAPSPENADAARSAFDAAVTAWSAVEIIRIGPATEANRLERILFWPDRRGIGPRQVQAILAAREPDAADPAALAGKSVAVQGLGALEFVLSGTGSEALAEGSDPFRCAYGQAIATGLAANAAAIRDGWSDPAGIAALWRAPAADNPLYRSGEEALNELLDVLVHGIEQVGAVRLAFLGDEPAKDRPRLAIFWRSRNTVASLRGNLDGLARIFHASGITGLVAEENRWVGSSVAFEFANADRALAGLDGPIDAILADPERRGKLAYLRIVVASLSELVGTRLAGALGLTAGFSSLDGD